ncbi:MAG TPA: glycosyltransferase 87 family protein [Thermoleophilaceae bacterium]
MRTASRTGPPAAGVAQRAAAAAALAGLAAASLLVVAGAQGGLDVLVPAAKVRYPGWLHGPLGWLELDLAPSGLAALVLAMCACYLGVLALADAVARRTAVAAIVALHLAFALAPPLLSSDVLGYVDLGRLGALHGIDPYSEESTPTPADEVRDYRRWGSDLPSPYGPLFTASLYPLAPLGVAGALWALKAILAAASLLTVGLVWRCAERLGRDPARAAMFVGLNPVLLVWGVGGAHNDFLLTLALCGGILLALSGRERRAGAALTAAAAVKASAALPLAFMLAGSGRSAAAAGHADRPAAARRGLAGRAPRREVLAGVAAAVAAVAVLTAAMFGTDAARIVTAIRDQQDTVALYSFPNRAGEWLGYGGLTDGMRAVAAALLAGSVGWLLWRTWRGADWVAAAGWATFALLVTSAWLLPWYLVWLLPLAALADDSRLRAAALAAGGFVVYTRVDLWLTLPS